MMKKNNNENYQKLKRESDNNDQREGIIVSVSLVIVFILLAFIS